MAKITVYKIGLYDAVNDTSLISRRLATRKGAEIMRGWVIEDSAIEIDEADLENGEQWTARNYNPHPRTGFQTKVL